MQFPYDRLEMKKDDGSVVRIFCENDDEEASYQWNTVLKRKTVIILWVLKGGGGGLQIPFPTQNFAQIPFPSQFFDEIPVPKFSTPHSRINVFSSSLTEQFKGISNLQFSECATRLVSRGDVFNFDDHSSS